MHSRSVIHPNARIGKNVEIGPFSYIEEDVHIGDNTRIEPNVIIYSGSSLGENCHVFPGTVVGAPPQDLGYKGEKTTVEVGNNVVLRENVTLHRGSTQRWKTSIGDDCFLMAYTHVAHDCIVGNNVIIANSTNLGGHVEVGDHANFGGMVGVHQFSRIGKYVMVAAGITIRQDVPHFVKVGRDPASYVGVNSIGLKRKGFAPEDVAQIADIYRYYFVKIKNRRKALVAIETEIQDSQYKKEILDFLAAPGRSIIKGI